MTIAPYTWPPDQAAPTYDLSTDEAALKSEERWWHYCPRCGEICEGKERTLCRTCSQKQTQCFSCSEKPQW